MSLPPTNFRYATEADTPKIMEFIDKYWKTDHILARNREFFTYQYKSSRGLNFVLAENKNKIIDGLLGFIPSNKSETCIWLSLWKVRNGTSDKTLGLKTLKFLIDDKQPIRISCNGINKDTEVIYQFLGYKTGQLEHYYMPNFKRDSWSLAKFKKLDSKTSRVEKDEYELKMISGAEFLQHAEELNQGVLPMKDSWYFEWRYLQHPNYKYLYAGVLDQDCKIVGLLVMRRVSHNNSYATRLVDFIGDPQVLVQAKNQLTDLVAQQESEYLDFYCYGLDGNILSSAGFRLNKNDSDIIVPNYFEPFVQKNIPIHIFSNNFSDFRMFKADGDQDRPNQ